MEYKEDTELIAVRLIFEGQDNYVDVLMRNHVLLGIKDMLLKGSTWVAAPYFKDGVERLVVINTKQLLCIL